MTGGDNVNSSYRRARAAILVLLWAVTGACAGIASADGDAVRSEQVLRGRNIVVMNDCNDCHTAGYAQSGGHVPQSRWLSGGDRRGFHGPWGVSHAPNLRAVVAGLSPAQWIELARDPKKRPPMPRHNLSDMRDADLKAVYWFIKSLGPAAAPPHP